jgi:hypothetical protein
MMLTSPDLERLEREYPRVVVLMLRQLTAAHKFRQAEGTAGAATVAAAISS